jgi:DNA-directed RNA polymerase specialized sigma24 family protein
MNLFEDESKMVYCAVRRVTSDFQAMPRGYEKNDLMQEGWLAWLEYRDGWSEGRGAISTFLYRVVEMKIKWLIRKSNYQKRVGFRDSISFIDDITLPKGGCR